MEKVKLSTLSKDTIVLIDGYSHINTVEDLLDDLDFYRTKEAYTTTTRHACFDAESIIYSAIEDEYQYMYKNWDDKISADITKEDVEEIQKIFDRILSRNPSQNVALVANKFKLIEFDI